LKVRVFIVADIYLMAIVSTYNALDVEAWNTMSLGERFFIACVVGELLFLIAQ
jgi:hypothetical protein